jgi:antitoxin ParD1/3/4
MQGEGQWAGMACLCRILTKIAKKGKDGTAKEIAMATMNVSLPDTLKAWVEAQAESGLYANASDYVRDLIRRDQERANKLDALQRLISEGLESGESEPLDVAAFLKGMRAKRESGKRK